MPVLEGILAALQGMKSAFLDNNDLKYAQVIKNKQRKKLQKVKKIIIFGQNIGPKEISTSLIERQNLTFRQDNNIVARKTIRFSRKSQRLYNQKRIYCTNFNFCRNKIGLIKENEDGSMEKNITVK